MHDQNRGAVTAASTVGASPPHVPDPSLIINLAVAYRTSMVLFAAAELNVFTALSAGPLTAEQVAERCRSHPRPMAALLNACVAERLLTREIDRYRNTPVAEAFLVEGRPAYIGHGLKYSEDLYPAWGKLADLVRSNRPVVVPEDLLGADREKTRNFVLAMHNRARGIAAALPHGLDLRGRTELLDVGGGPGTYSLALVERTPGLRATVLDLPGVLEITKEILASHPCGHRIRVKPGDYTASEFDSGNDVVLLSGMMHRETPATCRRLLGKAFGSLVAGGLVVVSDVFFENELKDHPPFAAHFALNMMLTSVEGSAHAKTEMAAWMSEAGFRAIEVRDLPPPNPHTLVMGTRP